jgi:osmotically-inducible protein OsmY
MNKLVKFFVIPMSLTILAATGVVAESFLNNTVNAFKDSTNSTGAAFSDQNLERKVNNVLSAQVPKGNFTTASYYKHILLTGQVPTKEDKSKAEFAVKNTAGVKGIWNYLTVEANEDAAAVSKDAWITNQARSKLVLQGDVNSNNIKVVTDNRVVYLLGRDPGKISKLNLAIEDIKEIDGVSKVVNLIWK